MTINHQVPLFLGLSRQEYWSGLPYPSPEDPPDPETEPMSLMFPAPAGRIFITSVTWVSCIADSLPQSNSFCCLGLESQKQQYSVQINYVI